jgi:hypothetical protein
MKFQNFGVKNKMAAEDKLREEAARRMERRRKEGRLTFTSHFFCSQSASHNLIHIRVAADLHSPNGIHPFQRILRF